MGNSETFAARQGERSEGVQRLMANGFTALMQKPDTPTHLIGNQNEIKQFYELVPVPNEDYTQLFWPYKTSHLDEFVQKKKEEEKLRRKLAKHAKQAPNQLGMDI